jgi:hypothetical protein
MMNVIYVERSPNIFRQARVINLEQPFENQNLKRSDHFA